MSAVIQGAEAILDFEIFEDLTTIRELIFFFFCLLLEKNLNRYGRENGIMSPCVPITQL